LKRLEDAMIRHALARLTLCGALIAGLASPVLAGPPLVCFPFEIGRAVSLPWNTSTASYRGMLPTYDVTRLSTDTVALLTPSTPILVRMETLRRAALYASADAAVAHGLLDTMRYRAERLQAEPLASFDAGYLIETYRQIAPIAPDLGKIAGDLDGYSLVIHSLDARHGDPAIAFAAALITSGRGAYADHVRMARAGASTDVLLAKNIDHVASRQ
jgi:hypothetical protein